MIEERDILEHLVLDFMQMKSFAANPFIVERGEGIRLYDRDGNSYLDGLSGVFVASLGYGNAAIVQAATEQMMKLQFAPPLHGTNPKAIELATLLRDFAPAGMQTFKFLSGGSEATEAAMKFSRQYHQQSGNPRKYKIIGRYGGYHGATMGALSAGGGRDRKSPFEPLAAGFLHVLPPYCYHCPYDKTYGDCAITCAKVVEKMIEAEDPATVAAVIQEPISCSSAGFVVPPVEFHQVIREACDKHGVLYIFDEIITGFGRTGHNFAADYYGVYPDIICCGKGMSGGYAPLAAVLVKNRIWDSFLGPVEAHLEFHHGHTFGGNPVACAVGVAVLKQIIEKKLVDNSRVVGGYLRDKLEELQDEYPFIGDVRGAGLLQGMEFVRDPKTHEPFPADVKPGKLFEAAARERGMIARTGNEFIAFAPALITTKSDIDEMIAISRECLQVISGQLMATMATA